LGSATAELATASVIQSNPAAKLCAAIAAPRVGWVLICARIGLSTGIACLKFRFETSNTKNTMSDMQCPYCDADQEVCHDDGHGYEEDKKHEHTCSACGKTFVFTTAISFYYKPEQADCLNGADHRLKFRKSWPLSGSRMCCQGCDYERPATDEELAQNER